MIWFLIYQLQCQPLMVYERQAATSTRSAFLMVIKNVKILHISSIIFQRVTCFSHQPVSFFFSTCFDLTLFYLFQVELCLHALIYTFLWFVYIFSMLLISCPDCELIEHQHRLRSILLCNTDDMISISASKSTQILGQRFPLIFCLLKTMQSAWWTFLFVPLSKHYLIKYLSGIYYHYGNNTFLNYYNICTSKIINHLVYDDVQHSIVTSIYILLNKSGSNSHN